MKKISIFNGIYLYKNPIKQLVGPDLYIASDMMDYRENAPNIKLSFHKRSYNKHIKKQRYDSILISIEDVFIERDKYDKNLFHVSDDTGRHEMIWKKESSKHTFEEAQRKQLLREKDNVDEIIFKYIQLIVIYNH